MKKKFSLLLLLLCIAFVPLFATTANKVSAETHTVTFYLDREGTNVYETQSVDAGGYIMEIPAMPAPLKNGSVFKYWVDGNGNKFSFDTEITSNLSLYAEWREIKTFLTVTFIIEETGKIVNVQEVEGGSKVIAPTSVDSSLLPVGTKFVGWEEVDLSSVTANLTVKAELAPITYSVDIIGFNGAVLDTLEVDHGDCVDLEGIEIPAVPNYTCDNNFEGDIGQITSDGEIRLVYTPDKYVINFEVDGTAFGEPINVNYGETVPFPSSTPYKSGYVFIGWYKSLNDSEMYGFNENITKGFTLYAKFIPIIVNYEVKFFSYDGTQYGGTQIVRENTSAISPGEPYREGYEFMGWSESFDAVTENLNVYPTYRIKQFTITFVDSEGTLKILENIPYGTKIAEELIPTGVRVPEGYEFVYWDGNLKSVKEDAQITAKYRVKTFAVIFNDVNGVQVGLTQYVEYGKKATAPAEIKLEGYNFIGWSGKCEVDYITDAVVFTAKYEIITFTITFKEGETVLNTITVNYGDDFNKYEYAKPDGENGEIYILEGYLTEGGNLYNFNDKVTSSFTLYAKWSVKTAPVNITFIVDNQTYHTLTINSGSDASFPINPTDEGRTFIKWIDGEGNDISLENVTADIIAFATFEENEYIVTFKYGNNEITIVKNVKWGTSATAPTENLEKDGYHFKNNSLTCVWDIDFSSVKSDLIVTALYDINVYDVEFYNGENLRTTKKVEHGSIVKIISAPEKTGNTFNGWKTLAGEWFDFSTPITAKTEIYADFSVNSYNIYYYLNGALYDTVPFNYGAEITLLEDLTFDSEDEVFSGWSQAPDVMPASHVVVVGTTYVYKYYDVVYFVNGVEFERITLKEGAEIPEMQKVPTNLAENVKFLSWQSAPSVMPTANVRVDANLQILAYYKVNYYANGELFKSVDVLEGAAIPSMIEIPQNLPETLKFISWGNAPSVMPSANVRVDANLQTLSYYNVYYYINNEFYKAVKVLEGGAVSSLVVDTSLLPETVIFLGWINEPSVMPSENVRVDAEVKVLSYYKLTYLVNGEIYRSFDLLEGEAIPSINDKIEVDGYKFMGWEEIDSEVMPNRNLTINAILKKIVVNNIQITFTEKADGVYDFIVKIEGDVNFAGVTGCIDMMIGDVTALNCDSNGMVNLQDGKINFVWSKGENTYQETYLFGGVVNTGNVQEFKAEFISVNQIFVFDGTPSLVAVEYNVEVIFE